MSDPSAPVVPPNDDEAPKQEFAVMGEWLVLRGSRCTCGVPADMAMYGHEPGCGWDAVAKVGEVAPVLERFWRDRIADEIAAKRDAYAAERAGVNADEYECGDEDGYNRAMFDAEHLARGSR